MPLHILYIMLHPDRCVDHTLAEYLGQVLFADATANFVCINANGLRKRRKRLMLYKMLHDLNVGLCLITETHLRESELSRVRTPGYYRATEHCQDAPLGTWPGGEILILAHQNFSTKREPKIPEIESIIEHCSCLFFPTASPKTVMKVTGIYIPPSKTKLLNLACIRKLSNPTQNADTQDAFPHVLAGDFNITSWGALYEEWTQESGIMELTDPEIPTFASGTALDKYLFVPGFYIPSTFLPPSVSHTGEEADLSELPYYPARVIEYTDFSNHSPVLLPIPCDPEVTEPAQRKRIRVGNLSEEKWEERNNEMAMALKSHFPDEVLSQPVTNIPRFHGLLKWIIDSVCYRERRNPANVTVTDPFERFLMSNVRHPEMDTLLGAWERGDGSKSDKYISRISADGWRDYLDRVKKHDTRALFGYLARAEGRKPCGFIPADSSPLVDEQGRLTLTPLGKARIITQVFCRRFSANTVLNPQLPYANPEDKPLPGFQEAMTGDFAPLRMVELQKALAHMASGRTPGPDGLPMELFKKLPSMHPILLLLLNAIYQTGRIPAPLRELNMAPIP